MWFLEMECPAQAHVKRIEVMAKMRVAAADGAGDSRTCAVSRSVAREWSGSSAAGQTRGQRIVGRDSCIQSVSVRDLTPQGVARNVGEPAVAKSGDIKILGDAGSPGPDGRDVQLPGDFHDSRDHKTVTLIGHRISLFDMQIA